MSNQNDIVMLKSRKNNVLLPSIIEGTAISSDKPSKGIETLVDNFEKRLEIDEESKKLQQMSEDAKALNLSAETNREALATSVDKFDEVKVGFDAATKSASTIVDCIIAAIARAENANIKVYLSDNAKKTLTDQHEAYIKDETQILSDHHQKMRKLTQSCGGFYLTGWMAKLAVWSWVCLYAYFCITLMWIMMR